VNPLGFKHSDVIPYCDFSGAGCSFCCGLASLECTDCFSVESSGTGTMLAEWFGIVQGRRWVYAVCFARMKSVAPFC